MGTNASRSGHSDAGDRSRTVTRLLGDLEEGRTDAFQELFPLVYEELREIGHRERGRWRGNHTLDSTALVHEAYLRLVARTRPGWRSRAHFRAVAATAMRQILIDYARERGAQKRGGQRERVSLGELRESLAAGERLDECLDTLLDLDRALGRLREHDERQSRIVECRFFGGMSIPETAAALDISPATVKRGWSMAQAWLFRELRDCA